MGTLGEMNRTFTDEKGIYIYDLVDLVKQEFVKRYVELF